MTSDIQRFLSAALRAADPRAAMRRAMRLEGNCLYLLGRQDGETVEFASPLEPVRRLIVLGAGKAAAEMSAAVEAVLGDRITKGLIVTPQRHKSTKRIKCLSAGHPIPTAAGERAALEILRTVQDLRRDDLVLFLLSGGASALLPLPVEGLTLRDKHRVTAALLRSGADIREINSVRKHLSRIKGGRLAELCHPARLVTLILSDVLGNPLDAIGSGPTAPDPTTYEDAVEVMRKYRLWATAPPAIRRHLTAGAKGARPENPKPDNPIFDHVQNIVIGDIESAVSAVSEQARELGYNTLVLTSNLRGEARQAGARIAAIARRIRQKAEPIPPPACVIAGGELTVTVTGKGKGGRCQEFVLAAAREIDGLKGVTAAAFGTDGRDGPTDAAGAIADGSTCEKARRRKTNPDRFLARNDAYRFFKNTGGLIRTGPTGTNVNDVYLMMVR
ncbi:MAG TPA: glycerate kinase [Nitrospiria bacterium]